MSDEAVLEHTDAALIARAGDGDARAWMFAIARNALFRLQRRRAGEPPDFEPLESLGSQAGWGWRSRPSASRRARRSASSSPRRSRLCPKRIARSFSFATSKDSPANRPQSPASRVPDARTGSRDRVSRPRRSFSRTRSAVRRSDRSRRDPAGRCSRALRPRRTWGRARRPNHTGRRRVTILSTVARLDRSQPHA